MTDLSIIIISYNTKEITRKCVETVIQSLNYAHDINTEIIVVDNGSTDGSIQVLDNIKYQISNIKKTNQFKIIKNRQNLGYAKANNLAAKKAKGEYLLFLNSDIEVIEDAIPRMFNFYKQKEKVFNFLGGKLLNKNMTSQPSCGPFYSLPVIFGALFLRGDYWGLTRWSPNKVKEVDWVSGACFLTKKKFFNELGGFDENIFMYMDEIDLLYRAKKNGLKVGFYPEAKFIHLGSASSQGRTQPILQVYRGFLYFYQKHFSDFHLKILKLMLKLKAYLSLLIGKILKNDYLIKTYEEALKITKNFR
jgi:GT2 family glycosyltransferase